jgi:hypothetical protein
MNHFSLRNFIISLLGLITPFLMLSSYILAAQIKIAWDANTEPDSAGYKVYYGTASGYYGGSGTTIDVGNVTTYTLTGLTQGKTYYIVVTAYGNAIPPNESGYSNEVSGVATDSGTPLADSTPPSVTGFTIPVTSSSLAVSITSFTATDNTAVTGYMVNESAIAPAASAAGWSATAPTSFTASAAGARTLYAWAKDAAGNVSTSRSASVTISLPPAADTTAPTVTAFTIPTTSNSLTVSITTFTATDNIGVTRCIVTETASAPSASAAGWTTSAPTSYTFATAGAKTLYAWAKDAAGNVSTSRSASVTISLSPTTPTPLNDTGEFVKQVYRDFLNREADTAGLQFWVNMIDSGAMTRTHVIDSFLWSEEFELRIAPIVRLYLAYFLRIPDYAELKHWIDQHINGQPLESISDTFAASQEFQERYGTLSNEQFVTLVYQNVLGRSPDPRESVYWVGQLNLGFLTRGQLMIGVSESTEYKGLISIEVFVTMTYVGILGRSPNQGGFDYWVRYLDSGNSEDSVIDAFLNSQEYANRF